MPITSQVFLRCNFPPRQSPITRNPSKITIPSSTSSTVNTPTHATDGDASVFCATFATNHNGIESVPDQILRHKQDNHNEKRALIFDAGLVERVVGSTGTGTVLSAMVDGLDSAKQSRVTI
ncbi:hypothetical protein F5B18DRAFT_636921 [Nemania serpens]|nr:hypothetical protein F5B18DRAFT_636921 [Nemania serpens]